jgi:hypothetical protein
MLRQPVPCCGWAATALGRQWIAGRWCCLGAPLFPQREGRPIRARAIASICCFRRFTLIGPSALAQTNSMGSIGGQKEEMRDQVRRPPRTAFLTATDSAPPPRESAMGCSRSGPSATLTPETLLYCEACFMVSGHVWIRTMMYARVLIHGPMDVTSPPDFL